MIELKIAGVLVWLVLNGTYLWMELDLLNKPSWVLIALAFFFFTMQLLLNSLLFRKVVIPYLKKEIEKRKEKS